MAQLGFNFDVSKSYSDDHCFLPSIVRIDDCDLEVTPVFKAYWGFAAERQRIFYKRLSRVNSRSFTDDPILRVYKFTNAYRASDRVSQYLIRNVIYNSKHSSSDVEVFFRILLFKFFNRIETWEFLEKQLGELSLSNYNFSEYDRVLTEHIENIGPIYSAAYIMPSAGSKFGHKYKHQNHLRLLEWMLESNFVQTLNENSSMVEGYETMLSAPSIGPFLAYQYITDINYSNITNHTEDEFVMAGPGALDGISKCFVDSSKVSPASIIKFMMDNQDRFFNDLGENFSSLWGRELKLIDCQNLFCEISKYSRVAFPEISGKSGRTRIKQKFGVPKKSITPFYPPKWGINDKIVLH